MPLIQSTLPITPLRPASRPASQQTYTPAFTNPSASPLAKTAQETGDKAIEAAAPPSVLQLQIKAIISEQALHLKDQSTPESEDPS
jgi:hypothetical protein